MRHGKRSKIELMKERRSYKEAWDSLRKYAKEGYDSIEKDDLDFFLKCFGIYDRPATPGKFMMRIRIRGGRLDSEQARTLGRLSMEYGGDHMDLTTRMQVQLRHLDISDIPDIIRSLEEVGLSSWQTGVDNFRNIVSDPIGEDAYDSILDVREALLELESVWFKKEEWIATLPRKFNTSISGNSVNRCNLFSHDCCFAPAIKSGEYGFNVYLGGKVGAIAESADIFLLPHELVEFYIALVEVYRNYGFRDRRNRSRLHYLIEEAGMGRLREAVEERAGYTFRSAGDTIVRQVRTEERDGRIRLRDGSYAVQMLVPAGRFSGSALVQAAELAQEFGDGRLRLSTTQNLYIMGVDGADIPTLLCKRPYDRYGNLSSPYLNSMVACIGSDLCPFGVIPNKSDAIEMSEYLDRKVPLPADATIRMHWSGCLKGCGVHELGDIGFVGCKVREGGKTLGGVHIELGGKASSSRKKAYTILKSITLEKAPLYVEKIVKAYAELAERGESFEDFESRVFGLYSKGAIEFILRWNVEFADRLGIDGLSFDSRHPRGPETNEIFTLGLEIYRSLTSKNAYQGIHLYNPVEKSPARHPSSIDSSIAVELGDIVMKMIAPSQGRYEVFTEVLADLRSLKLPALNRE